MKLLRKLAVFMSVMVSASFAAADPISYIYESPNFNIVDFGIPDGVTSLTIEFTVDLAAGLVGQSSQVTQFSFFDGETSITNASADYKLLSPTFSTDEFGFIIGFNMTALWWPFNNEEHPVPFGEVVGMIGRYGAGVIQLAGSSYCIENSLDEVCIASAVGQTPDPGQLAIIRVPEPSTLALLGIGLAGMRLARRRRWHEFWGYGRDA